MQGNSTTATEAAWVDFIRTSDRDMRRNDLTHGVTYEAKPGATARETVRDYVATFGGTGVGEAEVIRVTGVPRSTVKRALAQMVEDGEATVVHTLTRGKLASRRAVYYPAERQTVAFAVGDGTTSYDRVEYTCGGGRSIRPRAGAQ